MNMKLSNVLLVLCAAAALLFTGCPDDTEEGCTLDADCTDQVCEDSVCVDTCADDSTCGDKTCGARPSGGEGQICIEDTTTEGCTEDATCITDEDPNATCNTDTGMCEPGQVAGASYSVVEINDVSTAADACDEKDPGIDLVYAALTTSDGTVRGYAKAIALSAGDGDDNEYKGFTHMDGVAPDNLRGGDGGDATCPERVGANMDEPYDDSTVVSTGCGGSLIIQFVDDSDAVLALDEGDQIIVNEYGPRCFQTPGMDSDSTDIYDIAVCLKTDEALAGTVDSCTLLVGEDQKGYTTNAVPALPEATE